MKKFKWKYTVISIFLTPILLFLVFLFMGAGHGTFKPAIYIFPYGMLITHIFNEINLLSISVSCFQFFIYGLIFDTYLENKNLKLLLGVLIGHLLLIFFLLHNMTSWRS